MLNPSTGPDREPRRHVAPPDPVPRYRRCGQCSRCHGGGAGPVPPGDCWADYLDAVTAALTRPSADDAGAAPAERPTGPPDRR
ncbi:hypothetical protein [Kitasatospora sp. KL5]|uniref:hypothetical protein n=1 Tax=Kitasatospora sp. KL5 TaxID=3425125 RepID=UPI003D6DF588